MIRAGRFLICLATYKQKTSESRFSFNRRYFELSFSYLLIQNCLLYDLIIRVHSLQSSLVISFPFLQSVLCTHDWSRGFVDRRITVCDQDQNILHTWSVAVSALVLCENLLSLRKKKWTNFSNPKELDYNSREMFWKNFKAIQDLLEGFIFKIDWNPIAREVQELLFSGFLVFWFTPYNGGLRENIFWSIYNKIARKFYKKIILCNNILY